MWPFSNQVHFNVIKCPNTLLVRHVIKSVWMFEFRFINRHLCLRYFYSNLANLQVTCIPIEVKTSGFLVVIIAPKRAYHVNKITYL